MFVYLLVYIYICVCVCVCVHIHIYIFILLSIHLQIFFLKNSSIFNWRIIALQYCVDLYCISTCISQMYTYAPSLLNLPPISHPIPFLQVVTGHWFWAPCSERTANSHWLSILHMVTYMFLSDECMLLGSLSCHNKNLEWRTLMPPRRVTALGSWTDRVIALRSRLDRVIALK